jgi:transposase
MRWTVVVGVDTHKLSHTACALDRLGRKLASIELSTDSAGYRALLDWALSLGQPVFAVEGTGSYGAGLCRYLQTRSFEVLEVERPKRKARRRGKSESIDAELAARELLSGERLAIPRGGGERELLRVLTTERRSARRSSQGSEAGARL